MLPILPYIYISVLFRTCSLLSDLSDSVSFCGLLPFVCNFTHRHIDAYGLTLNIRFRYSLSSCCRDLELDGGPVPSSCHILGPRLCPLAVQLSIYVWGHLFNGVVSSQRYLSL